MRNVHLTSPLMRGVDVQHLQQAINARLKARGDTVDLLKGDGLYGKTTAHSLAVAAYDLGLDAYDGSSAVTRLVEHPEFRTPPELLRAKARAKAQAEHPKGLAAIVSISESRIGIHENPADSNRGHPQPSDCEIEFYGEDGIEWCGCEYASVANLAGALIDKGEHAGFCPQIRADAIAGTHGWARWTPNPAEAAPGWAVLFCWDGSGEPEHIGCVKQIVLGSHIVTIEGNTEGPEPQWGGMVAEVQRTFASGFILGFAEPRILA